MKHAESWRLETDFQTIHGIPQATSRSKYMPGLGNKSGKRQTQLNKPRTVSHMCLLFFKRDKRVSNLDDNLISGTNIELWLPTRTFHAALMSWSKSQMLISWYIFSMLKTKPPHMLEVTLYDLALFFSNQPTPPRPRSPVSPGSGVVWTWSPQKILHRHRCWRQLALWWSTSTQRDIQEFLPTGKKATHPVVESECVLRLY